MTTRTSTCTKPRGDQGDSCGGEIRASYIESPGTILGEPRKGATEVVHPAQCQRCAAVYADVVSVSLTLADLEMIGARLSASTRQGLQSTATEGPPSCYAIEMTEHDARDLASKASNLGLVSIAAKVRQELTGLTMQRRQP